jgi:hypothetical protein
MFIQRQSVRAGVALMALLLSVVVSGCDAFFEDTQEGEKVISFQLRNDSADPVHLWTPKGTASQPGSVLAPGQTRETSVKLKVKSFNDLSGQRAMQIMDSVAVASQRPGGEVRNDTVSLQTVNANVSITLAFTGSGWRLRSSS